MSHAALEALRALIARHDARFIDLKLVDLLGNPRHVTLPVETLSPEIFTSGTGFDGSSYGFRKTQSSDMVMIPDLATARLDPFRAERTLSIFASAHVAEDGLPLSEQDSRGILQRALSFLQSLGLADEALFALEYEFYIFKKVEVDIGTASGAFRLHGDESDDSNAYHLINPADLYDDFRDHAVRLLIEMKMPVRYHHHEVGGYGQQEIEFALEPALSAADHAVMVRYILPNLAEREGLRVTFMPKPLFNQPGSGLHAHQMLRKEGKNLFWDPASTMFGLSRTALHYIGGLLHHSRALAAFTSASTNSYKRLTSGFEAPNSITFGPADRTAAVRIPRWARDADTRIEYRPGDFTGNPYLSMAAMLLAGIDGILNETDPVAEGFGPAEILDPKKVKKLPSTLDAALEALAEDHDFLTRDGIVAETVIQRWSETKYKECLAVGARPHPYEFQLYF